MYTRYVSTAVTCRLWTGEKNELSLVISAQQASVSRMVTQSAFAVEQRQQQGSDELYWQPLLGRSGCNDWGETVEK